MEGVDSILAVFCAVVQVQLTLYSAGVQMYIVHVCTICSGPSAFVDSKGGSSVGPQDGGLCYLYNVGASVHRQFTFVKNAERRNLC